VAIGIKKSHHGLLHKHLGIPQGQPIPLSREESAAHSGDPEVRKEADFAIAARGFHHGGSGSKKRRIGVRRKR
jgi:hypothetical protein